MAAVREQSHAALPSTKRKVAAKVDADGNDGDNEPTSQVAHTLTACTRCRQRKTRCDPGLPRCTPCERTNSTCEYYDSNRGKNINRGYVVWLQQRVRQLEIELEKTENEDNHDDPEAMMRAATVRVQDAKESKYLGPASGIAITRLVMQLAKQFTDSKSIKDIVPEQRARQIKELYNQEQAKPTSKIYPLISDVAATELPNQELTKLLIQLYNLRVQPMYPALHEQTLDNDVQMVYQHPEAATPHQHFVCRMVIAISLQKMDTQYAGLADSYYLAALKYLEPVVRRMDLNTLQCFALMGEYSLLTPTRTAIYYVVGIAVRLAQSLGLNEEKTITRPSADGTVNYLEIDMRRRLFWCTLVMECGLAHSLGRPSILATGQEHIDVKWFETCDDKYITPDGIDPTAPRPSLKKWVAIHFFKMRLLQLEIRRKLYQRKRSSPKSDSDPWFIQMDAKLSAWRDAAPSQDEGFGLDKVWFTGRYNTMIVFLYRPSPQVPRPSLEAAMKCYEACEYNVYMHREQILKRNVEVTWAFTQSIFMAINTILWSLSYVEVRRQHDRETVQQHLEVAMDGIQLASERWPGVASAMQLYTNLIAAVMKIYEKEGDIPILAASPSDVAASPSAQSTELPATRSRATSPATVSTQSITTPPLYGYPHHHHYSTGSLEMHAPTHHNVTVENTNTSRPTLEHQHSHLSNESVSTLQSFSQQPSPTMFPFDPTTHFNPLPSFTPDIAVPGWTAAPQPQSIYAQSFQTADPLFGYTQAMMNENQYPFPSDQGYQPPLQAQYDPTSWDMDSSMFGDGLTQLQQAELMRSLETSGMGEVQNMISSTLAAMTPKQNSGPSFQ